MPPARPISERHGERNVALPDQLAVDVKLTAARRALAVLDVGFAGHLELEAQLMASYGNRDVRFNVKELAADVVVDVVQLAILHVEGKTALDIAGGE